MDKYEYKLKLEQLQNLMAAGDYATASEMADTINWKKVRSSNTLCMVSDIYEKTEKYDACREVLLQAYDHSPIGRNIVSKLAEVSIKAKRIDEAEEYYNEFLEIAPKDNMRYVLAYEISCLKDAPLTDRIAILEELKEHEYTEKWAYELAALYGQADMRDKCVETCDELILWFGEGEYVEKALDLKRLYQPLTPAQEEKYKQKILAGAEYGKEDVCFHQILAQCSGNLVVGRLVPIINSSVYASIDLTENLNARDTVQEHRAIVAAVERHDFSGARWAMTVHLNTSRSSMIQRLDGKVQ